MRYSCLSARRLLREIVEISFYFISVLKRLGKARELKKQLDTDYVCVTAMHAGQKFVIGWWQRFVTGWLGLASYTVWLIRVQDASVHCNFASCQDFSASF
jgi:hypothetical protein